MKLYELFILAVGLSMDAFAVAICKGLAIRKVSLKHAAWVGLWFGGFQMLMPLLGFLLANSFAQAIASFDHWIAFLLLAVIGGNMIREALTEGDEEVSGDQHIQHLGGRCPHWPHHLPVFRLRGEAGQSLRGPVWHESGGDRGRDFDSSGPEDPSGTSGRLVTGRAEGILQLHICLIFAPFFSSHFSGKIKTQA